MNLGFLQEKTNPGGFGSLTALSGKMTNCINEPPIARLLVCMRLHKFPKSYLAYVSPYKCLVYVAHNLTES